MSSKGASVIDRHRYGNELRRRGCFSDLTIKIGYRTFPCHRIVLASATEYFRTMFSEKYVEAERDEVELKDVDADDFELLLQHIYGEPVSLNVGNDAYRLLRICHYLHPEGLEDLFTHYQANIDSIPINTVGRIYKFACKTAELPFAINLAEHIAKKFPATDGSADNAMLELSGSELLTIFEQSGFSVTSVDILDFLVRWAKFQSSSENRESLSALMLPMRLKDITEEAFVKIMVENLATSDAGPSSIDTDGDESKSIKLPFVLYTNDVRRRDSCAGHSSDRDSSLDDDPSHVNKYRAENLGPMFQLDSMDYGPVIDLKAVTVSGVRYILLNRDNDLFTPFVYSESTRYKLTKTDFKNTGSIPEVAALDTEIYLYNNGYMNSYKCEFDSWYSIEKSFQVSVFNSSMLSHDQSLYLIGGVCQHPTYHGDEGKYFQHYDARVAKCSLLSPMKYTHIKPASCVHNGVLYVSGGENLSYFTGPIECFDFRAGKWDEFESSLPWPSFGHRMIPYDNKIWFFGGWKHGKHREEKWNSLKPNLTWFFYDMIKHKWSKDTPLPTLIGTENGAFKIKKIFDVVIEI